MNSTASSLDTDTRKTAFADAAGGGRLRRTLLPLLGELRGLDYDFLAPTPASQARVLARPDRQVGATVADLLGWSLPCREDRLPPAIVAALDGAELLERRPDGLIASKVRVSNVFGQLFVHSRYPTQEHDSVFLGPDSYRFADFISRNLAGVRSPARILDYAAGAGVGGIVAATLHGDASVNASFAGVEHQTTIARTPADVAGDYDVIVTHPPFMIDPDRRAYRDGGDLYGGKLSLDWTLAGIEKLAPGGRFIMHTGVSIVGGRDVVRDALNAAMPATGYRYDYRVLDPDIFGDELDTEPYAQVDRIAAIGLCVTRNPVSNG
jgi:hypothetical protein